MQNIDVLFLVMYSHEKTHQLNEGAVKTVEGYSWFMTFKNFMIMSSATVLSHYLYVVILEARILR